MNWHDRYTRQAAWTRELRSYLFTKVGLSNSKRILEVGCGTGAILSTIPDAVAKGSARHAQSYGVDLDPDALNECRIHAPAARLTRGDALALPYAARVFDLTFCHFLLLWVSDPLDALREMKRVTARSGYVLALAEPDYGARIDKPVELVSLGRQQNEALQSQGAAIRRGAELGNLFQEAGIRIIETGTIRPPETSTLSPDAWQSEWDVLEHDLSGTLSAEEMNRLKALDRQAWLRGQRILSIPTYFACGQV